MSGSPPSKRARTGKDALGAETPAVRGDGAVDEWTRKWLGAGFPKDLLQALVRYRRTPEPAPSTVGPIVDTGKIPVPNAVRKRQRAVAGDDGESAAPASPPAFVVTYLKHGQWIDVESEVLGVYSNLAAANDHLLGYVSEVLGPDGIFSTKWERTRKPEYSDVGWYVAPSGCLSIVFDEGKYGTSQVEVLLHSLQDASPAFKIEQRSARVPGSSSGPGSEYPIFKF